MHRQSHLLIFVSVVTLSPTQTNLHSASFKDHFHRIRDDESDRFVVFLSTRFSGLFCQVCSGKQKQGIFRAAANEYHLEEIVQLGREIGVSFVQWIRKTQDCKIRRC